LESLKRGRKSEIDFLNGYILAKANIVGLELSLNKVVIDMVHEIEAGARTIAPRNLDELYASVSDPN
jgi:2-dehydropantoate 2-reductase